MPKTYTVCLAGNPNVGKSTLFNALTGLRQHTGNWTGKTVDPARGSWGRGDARYTLVDLPGVYSLCGGTPEEKVAARILEGTRCDCVVAVLDATALSRTLPLALELRHRHEKLLCCLNLMDEAKRSGCVPDPKALSRALCCPVIPVCAHSAADVRALRAGIAELCAKPQDPAQLAAIREAYAAQPDGETLVRQARALSALCCPKPAARGPGPDRILLGRLTAWPVALLLLFGVLWLTIRGANYPSALLERGFAALGTRLTGLLRPWPAWLRGLLLDGVYGTVTKVVAVMLPPMAIFFPLFTLLEEIGFLPRLALLLDRPFALAGSCGRQGLTMCMGCGCNAVGVTGCRIIGPPKQRLAAIVTNCFTPCNGRFPTLIFLLGFLTRDLSRSGPWTALLLTAVLALSCLVTLAVTALLRHTVLRGEEGSFVLELPAFRRPRFGRVLLRSVLERTLRVLGRAVTVAAPAGLVIWCLGQIRADGEPLLVLLARGLDPAASLIGLSGALLLAFLLSFPANELLFPLTVMILTAGAAAPEGADLTAILTASGFTAPMAVCAALFTLFHWPCSTTVLTVWHETRSLRWTAASVWIPTAVGVLLCALANAVFHL